MPILHLRCSFGVAAFLLCVDIGVPPPAAAQSRPPSRPSATVAIHQIQVAFIGSGMLGGGTLNYRGATYRFRLGGLGIGGVGVSRLDATGSVYNLRSLADFEGVYGQVRSGWAAGDQGRGTLWMQNANGVYLRLVGVRRGLSLTMGADGVRISVREVSRYRQTKDTQHAWTGLRALRTSAGSKRSLAAA